MTATTHEGSCLCGAVRFELSAPPTELVHCHCRMCQKGHGAAYATFARVAHSAFAVIRGQDCIGTYRSSDQARRTFCRLCGSTLQFIRDESQTFGLAASAFDTPLGDLPVREYHTDSRMEWPTP